MYGKLTRGQVSKSRGNTEGTQAGEEYAGSKQGKAENHF